jgi:hypothetical protein
MWFLSGHPEQNSKAMARPWSKQMELCEASIHPLLHFRLLQSPVLSLRPVC